MIFLYALCLLSNPVSVLKPYEEQMLNNLAEAQFI